MRMHLIAGVACAALIASPVAGQSLTLGNLKAPIARASGQVPAKSIKDLWTQINGLPAAKPPVGDLEEPELGANFDKVLAPIASNFPTETLLVPSWGSGGIAVKGTEGVGAFRFNCSAGQLLREDPIVWPGQSGKSHLHQFFGNLLANASSTYASLRAKGDTTCVNPLNRSAYWSPAMLDGKGNVIRPDYYQIYYKRSAKGDVGCTVVSQRCEGIPTGLRFIFGYDMVTGKSPTGAVYWKCSGPTEVGGTFRDLPSVGAVCKAGNYITVSSSSPTCWDGKRLDSPNHRDHLAYAGFGNTGKLRCPETHPVGIPAFSLQIFYSVVEGDTPAEWYLSSDDMTAMGMGKLPGGTSFHTDFMDAWEPAVKKMWEDNCIEKLLSCNGGDLGNGRQMKDTSGFDWKAHPRLAPVPPVGAQL